MKFVSFLQSCFSRLIQDSKHENPPSTFTENMSLSPILSIDLIPNDYLLTHPAKLPQFRQIAEDGHRDPRAMVYTLLLLNLDKSSPFPVEKLSALDFGSPANAYHALLENGLICKPPQSAVLAVMYTVKELKMLLRDRHLPASGNKSEMSARLLSSGFQPKGRRILQENLFDLTQRGIDLIQECRSDEQAAVLLAVNSIKCSDFSAAVSAYHSFDSKWGFIHTSGRNHTIFADYIVPLSRFQFIAQYPMPELNNSDEFKITLRACIIACTMCDHKERWEIADVFESLCPEEIDCPDVIDLYDRNSFYHDSSDTSSIIAVMRENVAASSRYVLEYYISHLKYLSKQAR